MGLVASGLYIFGLVVAMGLLCQVAGMYLATLFPTVSPTLLGLIVLGALVLLNLFGVALSELGQQILIVTTVFPILAIIGICLTHAQWSNLFPFAPFGFGNILKATKIVIFGFFGYECAASLFNVVDNPSKNVPKALTYSIAIVGILYTAFITSIILATPLDLFQNPCVPLSDVLGIVFPQYEWLLVIIHLAILFRHYWHHPFDDLEFQRVASIVSAHHRSAYSPCLIPRSCHTSSCRSGDQC